MKYIVRNKATGAAGLVETDQVYGWQYYGPDAKEVYCAGSWCQILGDDVTSFFMGRLGDLITEEIDDFQGDLDISEDISDAANQAIAEAIEQLRAAIAMAKYSAVHAADLSAIREQLYAKMLPDTEAVYGGSAAAASALQYKLQHADEDTLIEYCKTQGVNYESIEHH